MFPCPVHTRLQHQLKYDGILSPLCSIDILQRKLSAPLRDSVEQYLVHGARAVLAIGDLHEISRQLEEAIPERMSALFQDILELAHIYNTVSKHERLRVKLAKITTDSCRKFHVDYVDLRLLRTYAGPGVQWTSDGGNTIYDAPEGAAVFLKGKHFPGWENAEKIQHRSPPLSQRPLYEQVRILLTIDEAGACQ